MNILWIVAAVSALLQGGDAWTTFYGIYVHKPALSEGNLNKWNLLMVGNKFALLTFKPGLTFAFGAVLASLMHGQSHAMLIYSMIPGVILGAAGALMTVMNLKLLLK